MKVPSTVVKGDFNYLINPLYPDLNALRIKHITDFEIDKRLRP
jgi:hypothetical protein